MNKTMKLVMRTSFMTVVAGFVVFAVAAQASSVFAAPNIGGDTTTLAADCTGASSIYQNSATPEPGNPNLCLNVPHLNSGSGSIPNAIRIMSITHASILRADGSNIAIGSSGTILPLTNGMVLLNLTPSPNTLDASFTYVVVDPDNTSQNSAASIATVPIIPVNVAPRLTTADGNSGRGLTGTYYRTSKDLTTVPGINDVPGNPTLPAITRLDPNVNFNTAYTGTALTTVWGIDDVSPDDFSVRWTGQIKAPVDGVYEIGTSSDDGVRVWIDGTLFIDHYTTHGPQFDSNQVTFAAGSLHDIEITYYERGGGEQMILSWAYPGQGSQQVIPAADMYPGTYRPSLTYLAGQAGAVVDDAIKASDLDSTTMAGAKVKVTTNCEPTEDVLQFTNQPGITGSYNSSTCLLTLSGNATVAAYQAALRSVKYYNSNQSPTTTTRTIEFSLNDGALDSNGSFRDIVFAAQNHPPVITQGASTTIYMDEDSSPMQFSLTLDATDQENQSISWSIVGQASHGSAGAGLTGDSTSVSYVPTQQYSGNDSFVVQASDGSGGTALIIVNVVVAPHVDSDNVSTAIENAAPNSGDGNNDGVADSQQSNVTSLLNTVSGAYTTVAAPNGCTFSNVSIADQTTLLADSAYTYPLGMANFDVSCGSPGFTTTVTQYYYNPPTGNFVLRKLINNSYETIPNATLSRQTINGQAVLVVSYQLTDGGPLDEDGVVDGTIVDPAGPALLVAATSTIPSSNPAAVTPGAPNTGMHSKNLLASYVSLAAGIVVLIAALGYALNESHSEVIKK